MESAAGSTGVATAGSLCGDSEIGSVSSAPSTISRVWDVATRQNIASVESRKAVSTSNRFGVLDVTDDEYPDESFPSLVQPPVSKVSILRQRFERIRNTPQKEKKNLMKQHFNCSQSCCTPASICGYLFLPLGLLSPLWLL